MRLLLLIGLCCLSAIPAHGQRAVPFRPGMVITESVRIEPGTYRVPAPGSLEDALMVVRGDGITVDLTGVHLVGLSPQTDPDRAAGVAIRIEGGTGVVVRNGTIQGYRIGILARGTRDLSLLNNDLSYSWKPRLFSMLEHESLVDWLSFHNNEEREWMRFGAAVFLEGVRGGELRGNRAVQGMNGLLMTRTDSLMIRDNDFSYNSGLGIGMYRASGNTIVRNRLDYNVRGYSHGIYQRGQDSAGILLYAQSSNNVVAYNSATHSGDGLFLWAGQSTMETGEGGANDNLIFGNDFSFAPANGIEVTFSRNRLIANILNGNRYGVWGGYSYETEILGNCFAANQFGVAIEHGQDNRIVGNRFDGDTTAISLWANPTEPPDWGYPKHRDTRSRDHVVVDNVFSGARRVWRLENSSGHEITGNRTFSEIPAEACSPRALLGAAYDSLAPSLPGVRPEIPDVPRALLARSAIVVDEWGPYDGRSPKLWPVDTVRTSVRLRVLGPEGDWRVTGRRGLEALSAESGRTGDTLTVTPRDDALGDWAVQLEYVGEPTRSSRGEDRPKGEAVSFSFERFEPLGAWDVRLFAWSDSTADPERNPVRNPVRNPTAFDRLLAGEPLLSRREARLDYYWFRPHIAELPQERWALEATTSVTLDEGAYSLRTISDDAIRVWVDGDLVIDHWAPHESQVDYAPLLPGLHEVRVRYYQLGGWSELRAEVIRGSSRSIGSAGPR